MIYFHNFFQIYFLNKEIKVIKEIIEIIYLNMKFNPKFPLFIHS